MRIEELSEEDNSDRRGDIKVGVLRKGEMRIKIKS